MKGFKLFSFKPTSELFVVLLSWTLVVGSLYLAFQVFTTAMVAANFITFGFGTILIFGIGVPVAFIKLVRRGSISDLGLSKEKAVLSLTLGLILAFLQYYFTLHKMLLPTALELIPLLAMALAVGLFENIFFRGWLQNRLEDAFGLIPAVIIASICYSLYHLGYGMTWGEMLTLFYVGLFFAVAFRLTRSIFILYPFLTPSGALFTTLQDGLTLPFEATYGFVIVMMLAVIGLILARSYPGKGKSFTISKNLI